MRMNIGNMKISARMMVNAKSSSLSLKYDIPNDKCKKVGTPHKYIANVNAMAMDINNTLFR